MHLVTNAMYGAQSKGEDRSRAVVLLACAAFSASAAFRVCDPQLPQLALEFSTTTADAAFTITAFALAYGVLQLVYGPLGDRYGKFFVVAAAVCSSTVASVGCLLSTSLQSLIFFRGLAGATAAAIVPMSMAWIGDAIPYEERQLWLARFLTGTILGMAFGQLLGGITADIAGWRAAFGVLATIYLIVGAMLMREWRRSPVDKRQQRAAPVTAVAGIFGRQRAVIALRWPRVVLGLVCVEGALVFGSLAFIPTFVHTRFSVSLGLAGAIAAVYAAGGIVYILLARRLIARIGEAGLAIAGGVTLGAAFALMALAPTWYVAAIASVACGLGFYMLHSVLQTHATQMAPSARGTAMSLFSAALFVGQSAGVAIGGVVVALSGIVVLFAASAAMLPALSVALYLQLRRHRVHPMG